MSQEAVTPAGSELTLDFGVPGEIVIRLRPGSYEYRGDLSKLWSMLRFTSYDYAVLQAWEKVFLDLAAECREIHRKL